MLARRPLVAVLAACAFASAATTTAVAAPADRDAAAAAYDSVVEDSAVPSGWTGSTDTCAVGTESPESLAATLHTLNTIRDFAGLAPVSFDAELNHRALAAALMMAAQGDLSHDPPPSWKCYSDEGKQAAGESNLSLGGSGANAMLGYADDSGVDVLGHRRWLLDPSKGVFGSGSTGASNALLVFAGPAVPVPAGRTVAWPPNGWFPRAWMPGVWSVAVGGDGQDVRFDDPQVTMTLDGQPLAAGNVTDLGTSYGSGRTLSWTPSLESVPAKNDHELRVAVSGAVVDGRPLPISYTVRAFGEQEKLRFLARPTIARKSGRGTIRNGVRLVAKARVAGGSVSAYRWLRDGRGIKGAGTRTYRVRSADRGHRVSCRVTAVAIGGGSVSRTSKPVRVARR